MANPVLHIKDSYYFEVPKVLAPADFKKRQDFPDVWIRLDPDFQNWQFKRLYDQLDAAGVGMPSRAEVQEQWHHWQHANHANFAKPFDVFLNEQYQAQIAPFAAWKERQVEGAKAKDDAARTAAKDLKLADYLESSASPHTEFGEIFERMADPAFAAKWRSLKSEAGSVADYRDDASAPDWSQAKIDAYNGHLSGKILIPQPFGGELRNLYEKQSGFAISKFMVIELAVALILILVFSWLGRKVAGSTAPRGKLWNLLEWFCVFIKDEIAEPAIGHHDARRFTPLLWTIFFFVLGCNLFGMVPWAGAPTGAFGVTLGLALITFGTVVIFGMAKFGPIGFFLNQIPGMDLPIYMAIVLKPMILAIELIGLCIKHLVLAIRLLANMVAGHLVLLGVMGLAFGAHAALEYSAPGAPTWQWYITATIAIVGSTAFSILELFVAFLQAYIFTFLSALFIGASIHHH
jgi:F-type H+-transporting ATPase subunit a